MGNCSTAPNLTQEEKKKRKEEEIRNRWIEETIKTDKTTDTEVIKLLFLGAGESGKSTLLKNMILLHAGGWKAEERLLFAPLIHTNIVQAIKTLVKQSEVLAANPPPNAKSTRMDPALLPSVAAIEDMKYDDEITPQMAQMIKMCWEDKGVQETYRLRSNFQLFDGAQYFLNNVGRIVTPGYMPTDDDILRARIRTTGIVEHHFKIEDNQFRMFDVGGQRNARKKWIHCFQGVTSVIFVAALSCYDQVLYEDNTTNRMTEALNLFEDIVKLHWFERSSIILFLNKKDLFKEKVREVPLTVCFPEYDGPNTYRDGCKFIKDAFRARNKEKKKIFTHFTCAIDKENVRRVFKSVQHTIISNSLEDVNLIARNALVDHDETGLSDDDEKDDDPAA